MKHIISAILLLLAQSAITAQTTGGQNSKLASRRLIVEKIDSVVRQGKTTQSPITYFAALYNAMLSEVQNANSKGHFTDSALIDYTQKNFTAYYLNTLASYQNNDSIPYVWKVALDTNYCKNCSYIQWLALGTNAHINHDLYFILLNYFNQFGTTNHNAEKIQNEFLTISNRETNRIFDAFLETDSSFNEFEEALLRSGKSNIKSEMKNSLNYTWNNALEASNHPEKAAAITKKQLEYAQKNALRLTNPGLLTKTTLNLFKSLDALPFDIKIKMLAPNLPK